MSHRQRVVICGATGFIGRNILERFLELPQYDVYATWNQTKPAEDLLRDSRVKFFEIDLRSKDQVDRLIPGADIVIQAAATTSGSKEILGKPYHHVTDNAVMNSLVFRACYENRVNH